MSTPRIHAGACAATPEVPRGMVPSHAAAARQRPQRIESNDAGGSATISLTAGF